MKRIITIFFLFLSASLIYGASRCDSIKVFFLLNRAAINPALNNGMASMNEFVDGIAVSADSGIVNHIDVYGYASPEGSFQDNGKLSLRRGTAVADYISRHAGITADDIHVYAEGAAWEGLRAMVCDNPRTPSRDEVLQILDRYIPAACTDSAVSEKCLKHLKAIDKGRTYKWMLDNLFPQLRCALAVCTYSEHNSTAILKPDEGLDIAARLMSATDTAVIVPPSAIDVSHISGIYHRQPLHRLALKTNLLYYAVLMPNLEVEWLINKNWSVALEGAFASVGKYESAHAYRFSMLSPEVKRWIRPRAPWHGFYAGLFAGGGLYDYEKRTRGYRGEGVMGGLSVGFMWPIGRCLSMEAAIGAGYMYSRCKEYVPMEGHHVYQRTKDINYFGPLKVELSLVWRLWDINKPGRKIDNPVVQYE